jgi:hypothetical protein
MESNYPSQQQAEPTRASRLGTLLGKVRLLYIRDFRRWFAITAPTSVTAAFVLVITDQRARAIFRSIPRGTLQYHSAEIAEGTLFRFGGYFIGWLLGCFALGAVATVVSGLDDTEEDAWQRDSHQRARDHFGALFLVALLTFITLLIGMAAYGVVVAAAIKIVGWGHFFQFSLAAGLIGTLIVASIVSWFGMAIPLILRGNVGAWLGMKKSLEAADGNQGFLFLMVLQSLVGSYVAWYATHYGLQLLLPASVRFSSWYIWIALVVSALASAAVQPPMFIGFSLLADQSSRTASDAQTPSPSLGC